MLKACFFSSKIKGVNLYKYNIMDKISFELKSKETLLTQIKSYITSAPLRRIKRTGSIGLSYNTIRNLQRFYVLIKEYHD